MTSPDPNFLARLAEKIITAVAAVLVQATLRQVTWRTIKPLLTQVGECLIYSLTFRTPRKATGKFRHFTYAVVLYLLAIEATIEFICATVLSLDVDHPVALWRRGAGLVVALVMAWVAKACHVEADDLKNSLRQDSRKLW